MNKFKLIGGLFLIAVPLLVAYQNQTLFLDGQTFRFHLYGVSEYVSAEMPNAVFFLIFFLLGFLLAYFLGLAQRFKSRKIIQQLKAERDAQLDQLGQLKMELDALQGSGSRDGDDSPDGGAVSEENTAVEADNPPTS